jgi:predicted GNAT family N-acyltransferase
MNELPACNVVEADWVRDKAAIRGVRLRVFVEEQGIPEALEWDGRDAVCRHVLALAGPTEVVATGRLQADGRIGRMAVLYEWRGRGVGSALLDRLQHCALDSGLQRVYVHARLDVAGFYSRAGFQAAGQPFTAADIPHIEMRKVLVHAEVIPAGVVDPEISRD